MSSNNTGQMAWRTCFSSISYYGYKLDILKSAAQKYLRRREDNQNVMVFGRNLFISCVCTNTTRKNGALEG